MLLYAAYYIGTIHFLPLNLNVAQNPLFSLLLETIGTQVTTICVITAAIEEKNE